jgi:hypothetical protein
MSRIRFVVEPYVFGEINLGTLYDPNEVPHSRGWFMTGRQNAIGPRSE